MVQGRKCPNLSSRGIDGLWDLELVAISTNFRLLPNPSKSKPLNLTMQHIMC